MSASDMPIVPLPSASEAESLRAAAVRFAAANGDSDPSQIRLGASTRRALVALDSGVEICDDRPAYIVTLRGRFTAHRAHPPPGRAIPTGTVLTIIFDAATGRITDWGVGTEEPALERLAAVKDL